MGEGPGKLRPTGSPLTVGNKEFTEQNTQSGLHRGSYDALVLDARLRQSLVTVRSLGSQGLHVAALGTSHREPTYSSRWCQQAFVCLENEGSEAYFPYLEQLLEQISVGVLIASSDATVALIRRHRERIEQRTRIALAKEPALSIAVNKERTLNLARQLGLGIPRGVTIGALNDVDAAVSEVGLPAVVKPVESWVQNQRQGVGLASRLVTTPEEARLAAEELLSPGGSVLFQQFLSGRREAVNLLYADGQIYARFAQWARRTMPPLGGQSVLRQSIAIPSDIGEQAERLVREIELEGYSEVEFRRDGDGNAYLMEINPRLSASVEIAVRAGVDFPHLLYQWASENRIDVVRSYRVGGWMRHLKGDLTTTFEAVRQRGRPGVTPPARAIFDFFATFFIPMSYDYFDWRDPLPAWLATAGFVHFLSQRIGRAFRNIPSKHEEQKDKC
jgi:predicted ATP-grasp superfamily ATP-dependent carboligase